MSQAEGTRQTVRNHVGTWGPRRRGLFTARRWVVDGFELFTLISAWVLYGTPLSPVLRRLKQEDYKSEASLDWVVGLSQIN